MNSSLKKIRKIAKVVFLGIFVIIMGLSSCTWNQNLVEEIELPDSTISFSNAIIPIFETSCLSPGFCHDEGDKSPILTEARAFDELATGGFIDVDNPEQSKLYVKILDGGSMAQYVTAQERALILQWIIEGAENN